jgi:hypothetical protein
MVKKKRREIIHLLRLSPSSLLNVSLEAPPPKTLQTICTMVVFRMWKLMGEREREDIGLGRK